MEARNEFSKIQIGDEFMRSIFGFLVRHSVCSEKEILSIISFTISFQMKILGFRAAQSLVTPSINWYTKLELFRFLIVNKNLDIGQIQTLLLFMKLFQTHSFVLMMTQQLKLDGDADNKSDGKLNFFPSAKQRHLFFSLQTLDTILETESDSENDSDKDDDNEHSCQVETQFEGLRLSRL
jgi:hypothetical protein